MLTAGTQISGMQKRYRTALEAGVGGADVTFQLITARGDPGIDLNGFIITASANCLTDKLNSSTSAWDPAFSSSLVIDPTNPATYDMSFELGTPGFPTYKINFKMNKVLCFITLLLLIACSSEKPSGTDAQKPSDSIDKKGAGQTSNQPGIYEYALEVYPSEASR